MVEIIIALFFIGIAVKAFAQARRDPRFTPRIIALHVLAMLLFFAVGGFGGYVAVKASSWEILSGLHPDARVAVLVILFLLWLIIGLVVLVRYLNKLLKQEARKQAE